MASDTEATFKSEDYTVIDISPQKNTDPSINGSLPKIDNLEYFPKKVLLHIFSIVDDIDLLCLSDCSHRFEGIAKIAFKKKYTNKYFIFDGYSDEYKKNTAKMYSELFKRFGHYAQLKAVEVKNMDNIDENHWIPKLLRQYTNDIEKLLFASCSFKQICKILSQHINITHFILRSVIWENQLILPKYWNLKHFELSNTSGSIMDQTVEELIRNNPALKTLVLFDCDLFTSIHFIAEHLKHLKELDVECSNPKDAEISDESMNMIGDALKQLESLKIHIEHENIELVHHLSSTCTKLKHLGLYYSGPHSNDGIIDLASRFHMVKSLTLYQISQFIREDAIEVLVERSPNLCHLKMYVESPKPFNTAYILSLQRKCPSLKTIKIESWKNISSWRSIFPMCMTFFKTLREPNFKIKFIIAYGSMSYITKKELIWCNDQSHWIEKNSFVKVITPFQDLLIHYSFVPIMFGVWYVLFANYNFV